MANKKQTAPSSAADVDVSLAVRCAFAFLVLVSEVLLFGSIGLIVYWVLYYQGGVAWNSNHKKQFNLHYILMTGGFIFLNGQSMLVYRCYFCCKKIYLKILHTIIFVLSISAITIGLITAFQAREDGPEPKHFYSLHAWIGLAAMGMFALQFLVGFVAFLVLLCCEKSTVKFRQNLLPTHVTFGLTIFSLGSVAVLTGLMQSANNRFNGHDGKPVYSELGEQPIVVNTLAIAIVGLMVLLPFIILNKSFKRYTTLTLTSH